MKKCKLTKLANLIKNKNFWLIYQERPVCVLLLLTCASEMSEVVTILLEFLTSKKTQCSEMSNFLLLVKTQKLPIMCKLTRSQLFFKNYESNMRRMCCTKSKFLKRKIMFKLCFREDFREV